MASPNKQKPRLGRGLSSLISVSSLTTDADIPVPAAESAEGGEATVAAAAPPHGEPLMVSLDAIRPNPHQPRKTIRESAITELAASLKSNGVIQPLVVKPVEGGFELIAGERRWLAAKLAGLPEVPVVVKHEVDDARQAQMALVENIQREDLNPLERAQAYHTLMEQLGLTQAELAERMGEERSSIANFLRLLDLSEPIRQMVHDGRLSLGHAKLLAGVADVAEQQKLADLVVGRSLSVRNLERLMQERAVGKEPAPPKNVSAHLLDLEKSLASQLGMRVQVRSSGKGKGRLVVHYATLDQFDDLMQRLGVKVE